MKESQEPNLNESAPRLIDLFDHETESKIRMEGQLYLRKIEPIKSARQVTSEETVETGFPDGTIESKVDAKIGDWVITGSKDEQFVFTDEKFHSLYDKNIIGEYVPKKRKILALQNPFNQPIKITAPWSTTEKKEYQDGTEKAMLVLSLDGYNQLTNDRYLIEDKETLLNNYKKSLEQFRHVEGRDEAVARIGSNEQLENLVSIVRDPGNHSREELLNAIAENYSGEVYGDQHIEKEYSQWGGPNHGELITTVYGEFRNKYPQLTSLSLDPGFMNHLPEFMEMVKNQDIIPTDDYKEVRKIFKEKLGNKEMYRGMTLSPEDVEIIKLHGIISSIGRENKNSRFSIQDEIEAKLVSVRPKEMINHHFNGGADYSTFISVSAKEDIAATLGKTFGKNKTGDRKPYLIKMNLPVIEIIYEEHGRKVEKDVESFVFWKINPEEILEIKEVIEKVDPKKDTVSY